MIARASLKFEIHIEKFLMKNEGSKINLFICYLFIFFTPMKQSFTYSGDPKTRRDAIKKAKKEGMNFSTLVEKLLWDYATSETTIAIVTPEQAKRLCKRL